MCYMVKLITDQGSGADGEHDMPKCIITARLQRKSRKRWHTVDAKNVRCLPVVACSPGAIYHDLGLRVGRSRYRL
jgi:hypothetical protein